jgi:hypothetical protein
MRLVSFFFFFPKMKRFFWVHEPKKPKTQRSHLETKNTSLFLIVRVNIHSTNKRCRLQRFSETVSKEFSYFVLFERRVERGEERSRWVFDRRERFCFGCALLGLSFASLELI